MNGESNANNGLALDYLVQLTALIQDGRIDVVNFEYEQPPDKDRGHVPLTFKLAWHDKEAK